LGRDVTLVAGRLFPDVSKACSALKHDPEDGGTTDLRHVSSHSPKTRRHVPETSNSRQHCGILFACSWYGVWSNRRNRKTECYCNIYRVFVCNQHSKIKHSVPGRDVPQEENDVFDLMIVHMTGACVYQIGFDSIESEETALRQRKTRQELTD
jgi:hypothetical protein